MPVLTAPEKPPPAVAPRLKVSMQGDNLQVANGHPDQEAGWAQMQRALGASTKTGLTAIISDIVVLAGYPGSRFSEAEANNVLALVEGIKPRDQLELMLATQMAAIHRAMIEATKAFAGSTTIAQRDSAERVLNRLARTFASQVQSLKLYRSKGKQIVRVERVVVNDGGQAIVGVAQAGGSTSEKESVTT